VPSAPILAPMKLKSWALCFLILLLGACHSARQSTPIDDHPSDNIIGGNRVEAHEKIGSFLVFIYKEDANGESSTCSGSFISKRFILTAAHCLSSNKKDIQAFFTYADEKQAEPVIRKLPIKSVIIHKGYFRVGNQVSNDIGLIELHFDIPKQASIASLPDNSPDLQNVTMATALGFGIQDKDMSVGELAQVDVTLSSIPGLNPKKFVVDQSERKGSCFGDSGGPALYSDQKKTYVMGVAIVIESLDNYSDDPLEACYYRSYYLKVAPYRKWIESKIL
jgi:secreted trypsin-like serine protease